MKKKILFDIIHLCHFNFFKNAIIELDKKGYEIEITYLDRGKIKKVLDRELPQFPAKKMGTYRGTTIGKIPMTLERLWLFSNHLRKSKPNLTLGVGDFVLAFCSRPLRIPSILFYDDFEFKTNFMFSEWFGNKLYVPNALPKGRKKRVRYPSFKELAYLHPSIYQPQESIIKKIGLAKNDYVFVREVAGISMNYTDLKDCGLLEAIKHLHQKNVKVVLSLEDKSKKKFYEPYCTILEEPLEDIYSIMAFAKFMLSSGDSMARESALLGVPCIYSGGREMYVNKPFIKWGGVLKIEKESEIISKSEELLSGKFKEEWKVKIEKIMKKLINPTEMIVKIVKKYSS